MKRILELMVVAAIAFVALKDCDPSNAGQYVEEGKDIIEEGSDILESGKEILDNKLYDIQDEVVFDEEFDLLTEDVEMQQIGDSTPRDISVSLAGGNFAVKASPDDKCYITCVSIDKVQAYVKDGVLNVHALKASDIVNVMDITLYIPTATRFGNFTVSLGAGFIDLGSVSADSMDIHVGAGSIEGNLDFTSSLKLNCNMGNISVTLPGTADDYSYKLSVTAGQATIGENSYTGVSHETVGEGDGKPVEVDVAMGNITVSFTE